MTSVRNPCGRVSRSDPIPSPLAGESGCAVCPAAVRTKAEPTLGQPAGTPGRRTGVAAATSYRVPDKVGSAP